MKKKNKSIACVCHGRTLEGIVKEARERDLDSIREIQDQMKVCDSCKLCVPYVKALMDDTGTVV